MALFLGLPDWVVFAGTLIVLLYLYITRNRNYWLKQNVPHEKLSLIIRPLYKVLTKPVCLADQERFQKYGRLFGYFEGIKPALMVAEPELVKQVLVKDFSLLPNRLLQNFQDMTDGKVNLAAAISKRESKDLTLINQSDEFTNRPVQAKEMNFGDPILNNMMVFARVDRWRRIRPASSPAFTTGKLRKMHELIKDCVKITCEHLGVAAEEEKDADMKKFYGHYAVDVIARCAFGTKLDSQADTTHEFVKASQEAFKMDFSPTQLISMLFPGLLESLNISVNTSMRYTYFRELFLQIMDERKQHKRRIEDFLQLMIEAKEGRFATVTASSADAECKLFDMGSEMKSDTKSSSKALTEDEALAQCLVFFLAGQDTTSSTLAGAVYYLALNPTAQERLRKEADECFETHGPEPSLDVISKLKYLHCVVSETLRLLPSVPRTQRCAAQDYVLGDTGIRLPKGSPVVVPIYAMHHDPEVFPEPEQFNPDRFNEDNVESIRPYTYLPFGAGPRNCIGMRLALQSIKLCLLHSVHMVRFVPTEKTKVPLQIRQSLGTLRIDGTVVGIRRRLDTRA